MNIEDAPRAISKSLFRSASVNTPYDLEMLNSALLVCLGAYIISIKNDDCESAVLSYEYWRSLINARESIRALDFKSDAIYPFVPKDIRKAADTLSIGDSSDITRIADGLFYSQPDTETVRDAVNYITTHYYPLVITEPIDTPETVNRLCIKLLDPDSGTFYDGVSGIGSTCIEADRYARRKGCKLDIYAQEILTVISAVSAIRAYINGVGSYNGQSGDVLTEPQFTDRNGIRQFDYSVMLPPTGTAWHTIKHTVYNDRFKRFSGALLPKSNADWLFAEHQIASLKDGTGSGIIAVSTGALFNTVSEKFREALIKKGCIKCIITLPSKILRHTTIPLSLVVLQKTPHTDNKILMIQSDGLFDKDKTNRIADQLDASVIKAITSLYRERAAVTDHSRLVSVEEIAQNNNILLPSRYVRAAGIESETGALSADFYKTADWPSLAQVSETVYRGLNISLYAKESPDGEYKIINYADIQEGKLNEHCLKKYIVTGKTAKYTVKPGDIIVSCKGSQIKTCVMPDGICDTLLSINFIGIRINKKIYLPEFIRQYINSPAGQSYLKSRQVGTSIITLKNSDLKDMRIPNIPLEKQKECIAEFTCTQNRIEAEIDRLSQCLDKARQRLYEDMGLCSVYGRCK